MLPTTRRSIAPMPRASPTPSTDPTRIWVVDTGMPRREANTIVVAAASSAQVSALHILLLAPIEALVALRLLVGYRAWVMPPFSIEAFELALVAWAIKGTVLKYGGLGFFERLKPFFLGLILGEAVVAGFWVVVDFCTGMQSNRLGNIVMG